MWLGTTLLLWAANTALLKKSFGLSSLPMPSDSGALCLVDPLLTLRKFCHAVRQSIITFCLSRAGSACAKFALSLANFGDFQALFGLFQDDPLPARPVHSHSVSSGHT